MTTFVALLYSIVLPGGERLKMADLKALAAGLGYTQIRTILATGNLVFETGGRVDAVEKALEDAFEMRFHKRIPIIVRTATSFRKLVTGNPFPKQSEEDPGNVMVRVMRNRFTPQAITELRTLPQNGELIEIADGDCWVYFPNGEQGTRVMPILDPKKHGVGTARGWNTIRKLGELLDA